MIEFPKPWDGTVFYEDEKAYACLAFDSMAPGHSIIIWKENVEDINDMSPEDYHRFMDVAYRVRKALLEAFKTDRVYLVYLNEIGHVNCQLIPRHDKNKAGFEFFSQPLKKLSGNYRETTQKIKDNLEG